MGRPKHGMDTPTRSPPDVHSSSVPPTNSECATTGDARLELSNQHRWQRDLGGQHPNGAQRFERTGVRFRELGLQLSGPAAPESGAAPIDHRISCACHRPLASRRQVRSSWQIEPAAPATGRGASPTRPDRSCTSISIHNARNRSMETRAKKKTTLTRRFIYVPSECG